MSMVVSVLKTTERTEFEDGNQFEARNNLQRVCTIPKINVKIVPRDGVDQVPPRVDQGPKFCSPPFFLVLGVDAFHRKESGYP